MFLDDIPTNNSYYYNNYKQDEAQYFLYFDHSDNIRDNTLSIKT